MEHTLTAPEDSILATTNSSASERTNDAGTNENGVVTPRRLDADSPVNDETSTSVSETSTARQSGSNRNTATTEGNESLSVKEVKTSKKRRRTSTQVQQDKAKKQKQLDIEKQAMKLATTRIERARSYPKGHRERKSALTICQEVNKLCGSTVSSKTAAAYVTKGLVNCSPQKRGPACALPKKMLEALKWSYVAFLKLEQANCQKQSTLKQLSLRVNACVNKAGFQKTRDDLTRRLRNETANLFVAGKANTIEHRRVEWTTNYNLNLWFSTWKETLIKLGFAREKTDADKDVSGEVVFLPGQTARF